MRTAALALACFLGAAARAAAGDTAPAYNLPPFPGGGPAAEPAPVAVPPPARAFNAARPRAEAPAPPRGRACLSQAEAREKIAQRRLTDPVNATRAGRSEGEALRTRLCRWKQDDFVYEVYVLRRDGRIMHLYVNAQNGQPVSAADIAEHK